MSAPRLLLIAVATLSSVGCYVAPQTMKNYVICTRSPEGLDMYESLLADYAEEKKLEIVERPRHQFAHEENLDRGPLTYLLEGDQIIAISSRLPNSETEVIIGIEERFDASGGQHAFIESLEDDFRVISLFGEGASVGYCENYPG